jgi:hypothetical protein
MVRWPPPDRMSRVSHELVERFKKTAGAKDLEQDAREWVLASWPWLPDAPYAFLARASNGEERRFILDADGQWRVQVVRPASPPRAA